ncbi:MAG: MotA/TolQ/ExbB proton channel family protein, partial [Verrucomicrobiota bacterium]
MFSAGITPAVSGVFYAFQQSDNFARLIIFLLFIISIQAWTIMIERGLTARKALRASRKFIHQFNACSSPTDMLFYMTRHKGPVVDVYESAVNEMADILGLNSELLDQYARSETMPRQLNNNELDRIRSTLERSVSVKAGELEQKLGMLGTVVTISPFLGLLGTVWGVMMAFTGMAQSGRPDIGAMAPGVSGALLTTVVGLLVAIPSVIGYNTLTNYVNLTVTELDNFVEDFMSVLKLANDTG